MTGPEEREMILVATATMLPGGRSRYPAVCSNPTCGREIDRGDALLLRQGNRCFAFDDAECLHGFVHLTWLKEQHLEDMLEMME